MQSEEYIVQMLSVRMRGFFMDCHVSLAMTKEVGDVDCHGWACALPRNDKGVVCNDKGVESSRKHRKVAHMRVHIITGLPRFARNDKGGGNDEWLVMWIAAVGRVTSLAMTKGGVQ